MKPWDAVSAIVRALRHGPNAGWQMHILRWEQHLDMALWLRAAERIEVEAGGVVPGELDLDALPEPTLIRLEAAGLASEWAQWWCVLVGLPSRAPDQRPAEFDFYPPHFPGMAPWPRLRELLRLRWEEARQWHEARMAAGMRHHLPPRTLDGRLAQQVQRRMREPFRRELILLPVRDDEIRQVNAERYLVPERIYDDEQRWARWLTSGHATT